MYDLVGLYTNQVKKIIAMGGPGVKTYDGLEMTQVILGEATTNMIKKLTTPPNWFLERPHDLQVAMQSMMRSEDSKLTKTKKCETERRLNLVFEGGASNKVIFKPYPRTHRLTNMYNYGTEGFNDIATVAHSLMYDIKPGMDELYCRMLARVVSQEQDMKWLYCNLYRQLLHSNMLYTFTKVKESGVNLTQGGAMKNIDRFACMADMFRSRKVYNVVIHTDGLSSGAAYAMLLACLEFPTFSHPTWSPYVEGFVHEGVKAALIGDVPNLELKPPGILWDSILALACETNSVNDLVMGFSLCMGMYAYCNEERPIYLGPVEPTAVSSIMRAGGVINDANISTLDNFMATSNAIVADMYKGSLLKQAAAHALNMTGILDVLGMHKEMYLDEHDLMSLLHAQGVQGDKYGTFQAGVNTEMIGGFYMGTDAPVYRLARKISRGGKFKRSEYWPHLCVAMEGSPDNLSQLSSMALTICAETLGALSRSPSSVNIARQWAMFNGLTDYTGSLFIGDTSRDASPNLSTIFDFMEGTYQTTAWKFVVKAPLVGRQAAYTGEKHCGIRGLYYNDGEILHVSRETTRALNMAKKKIKESEKRRVKHGDRRDTFRKKQPSRKTMEVKGTEAVEKMIHDAYDVQEAPPFMKPTRRGFQGLSGAYFLVGDVVWYQPGTIQEFDEEIFEKSDGVPMTEVAHVRDKLYFRSGDTYVFGSRDLPEDDDLDIVFDEADTESTMILDLEGRTSDEYQDLLLPYDVIPVRGDGSCGANTLKYLLGCEGITTSEGEIYASLGLVRGEWLTDDQMLSCYRALGGTRNIALFAMEGTDVNNISIDNNGESNEWHRIKHTIATVNDLPVGYHYEPMVVGETALRGLPSYTYLESGEISDFVANEQNI
jgi:hypothetical protein